MQRQLYSVGNFFIQWDALKKQLSITHQDDKDRVLWQSKAGMPFVKVAQGSFSIQEYQGNFNITDDVSRGRVTDDQLVFRIIQEGPKRVRMIGHLICSQLSSSPLSLSYMMDGRAAATEEEGDDDDDEPTLDSWSYSILFQEETSHRLGMTIDIHVSEDEEDEEEDKTQQKLPPPLTHLILEYEGDPTERIYGLGTQFTFLNLKGQRVPIWVSEQGVGRGLEPITSYLNKEAHGTGGDAFTSYFPLPYYVTSRANSFFLKNTEYSVFDFREPTSVKVSAAPNSTSSSSSSSSSNRFSMQASIISGQTIPEVLTEFSAWNGRMDPLPDWALRGAIVGMQGGSDVIRTHLGTLESASVPVAGLWLQDWPGKRHDPFGSRVLWNWEVNPDYYKDWGEMLKEFHAKGIRVLTYINPYMATNVTNYRTNIHQNLYEEAKARGYLVRSPEGDKQQPYIQESGSEIFKFATIDLTNPEATSWYSEIIKCHMLCVCDNIQPVDTLGCGEGGSGIGVSGWMADFAEYLPTDALLWSGQSAESIHNDFPRLWAELNRKAVKEAGRDDDTVFFMRAGFSRSVASSRMFWLGDQLTVWDNWDGLASALTGMLSSGLSGNALSHSDLGGYTALNLTIDGASYTYQRSKELLLRWIEMSAFSDAIFRSHEGNRPLSNVQVYSDAETLAHLARFATVFASLSDYKKGLMMEAKEKGWPLTRPLFWHYPEDTRAWNVTNEFMLGPDVLVTPVLHEGAETVDVYLPRGEWVHLWTCKDVGNDRIGIWMERFEAPLGQPAVFYSKRSDVVARQLKEGLGITCLEQVVVGATDLHGNNKIASLSSLPSNGQAAIADTVSDGSNVKSSGETGSVLSEMQAQIAPIFLIGLLCPLLLYIVMKTFGSSRARSSYVALNGPDADKDDKRESSKGSPKPRKGKPKK